MLIGQRLRSLRENEQLSQGDIEKRTGLLRCYISRVENGHTVPAIEPLEKIARAMEITMYQLFYEGAKPPEPLNLPTSRDGRENDWGGSGKDAKMRHQFRRVLARTNENDQKLLLHMAQKMASAKRSKA